MDSSTTCQSSFELPVGGSANCADVPPDVPKPLLIDDLAAACDFPPPGDFACSSDASRDVFVDHDQTVTLAPDVVPYRNLVVEGGGRGPAVLKLTGGNYTFCNVRVGRNGSILFAGPSTVNVAAPREQLSRLPDTTSPRRRPPARSSGSSRARRPASRARATSSSTPARRREMIIGSGTSPPLRRPLDPLVHSDVRATPGGPTTNHVDSRRLNHHDDHVHDHDADRVRTNEDRNVDSPSGGFISSTATASPSATRTKTALRTRQWRLHCEDHHCVPGTTTTSTTTSTPTTSAPTSRRPRRQPCATTDCPTGVVGRRPGPRMRLRRRLHGVAGRVVRLSERPLSGGA